MNANPPEPSAEESHATKGLLRLTMACNERCPFCNVPMEDYESLTPDEETTQQELDAFIEAGDQTLTISGGEPTLLRRRLLRLVTRARQGGMAFVEVQTNATLIDTSYAEALREAGVTSAFVSLLSHVPALHDELAGLEGAFEKCIRGIHALTEVGIRVALNPVTARTTQHLIPDYVDFVAATLPGVTSISLSAVQPHGRARQHLDLMPDYGTLRQYVLRAQVVAQEHGIDLLNPYCGLPLCVGWSEAMSQSVEAIEAQASHTAQGLQNSGNKRHGEPCMDCGLRTRCGGAWHAYWDHCGGSGIQPPWEAPPPWAPNDDPRVMITDVRESTKSLEDGSSTGAIVHWLWATQLDGLSLKDLLDSGISQVAVDVDLKVLKPTLARIRRWSRAQTLLAPQKQILFHLRLPPEFNQLGAQQVSDFLAMFRAVGVTRVHIVEPGPHDSRIEQSGLFGPVRP